MLIAGTQSPWMPRGDDAIARSALCDSTLAADYRLEHHALTVWTTYRMEMLIPLDAQRGWVSGGKRLVR